MKIFTLFIVGFLLFNIHQVVSQPSWTLDNAKRDLLYPKARYFYYYDNIPCKQKEQKETKIELRKKLLHGLSKKIHTTVKSETTMNKSEITINKSSVYADQFQQETSIASSIKVSEQTENFYFSKKLKKLYGIVAVEKSDLIQGYESRINMLLNDLEFSLAEDFPALRKDQLVREKKKLDKQATEIKKEIITLGTISNLKSNKAEEFNIQLTGFLREINALTSLINSKEFEEKFAEAKRLLNKKECKKAYHILQDLLTENSSDERITNLLDRSRDCQVNVLLKQISFEDGKDNYERSIQLIDELIGLKPSYSADENYKKMRSEAVEKYLEKTFQEIENVIEIDVEEAARILRSINLYGEDQYKSRYDDYNKRIKTKRFERLQLEFKNYMNQEEFRMAHKVLLFMSKDNAGLQDVSKTTSRLNAKWKKKVKKHEKKLLLYERSNLYSAKLNFSFFTPTLSFVEIKSSDDVITTVKQNTSYLSPYVSVAAYRKFGIKTKFSNNTHRDKSRANLIGLKFGMEDITTTVTLNEKADSIVGSNNRSIYEFQLSSLLLKCLNLNYGLLSGNKNPDSESALRYTTTFGIKIPVWSLDLDFNVKYISDYGSEHVYLLEGGISYNFNFKKSYTAKDKIQVDVNVRNYQ